MLRQKTSTERVHYKNLICQKLLQIREKFVTNNIYLDQRSEDILLTLVSGSEIFGTGLTELYTKNTLKQKEIQRIVIVTYFGEASRTQIQRFLHLFSEVFILNLTISDEQTRNSMKVSPIRKKLKGFVEISMNFISFIDSVYMANKNPQHESNVDFQEGLTSYLTSLPKFYQYQIFHPKKQKDVQLAAKIQQKLKGKLEILEKHKSAAFNEISSPRMKILLLNRTIDPMSPLVYSFYFGPISKQLNLLNQFTTNSVLYSTLFSMDIQQSSEFLQKLISQKALNQKLKFQLHEFDKAKQAITMHYDQNISSKEIQLQIEQLNQIKIFCKKKLTTSSLQQTIINNRSEEDQKMSPSKLINRIVSWIDVPLEQYKPTLDDYIKILILIYMVNSLWFFQRRIINAVIKSDPTLSQQKKDKIIKYCKKVQNQHSPLKEKIQGQQRYDLYRHQPKIVKIIKDWLENSDDSNLNQININKTATKKQNRIVIAFNGPLGHNEIAFIFNFFNKKQQKYDVTIFCEKIVTNQQYLDILLTQNII